MENYELTLTQYAQDNIDETLEILISATQDIASAQEKDFERIKEKRWYTRLWELVTFSKDNQKIQSRGVSNLAKLNEITLKAVVLVARISQKNSASICKMLDELGAVNIADEARVLIDTLSMEAILKADPDCILITTMGDEAAARAYIESLLTEPTWQSLRAVREGRVHILPKELFQYKPCDAWYEAYKYLSELIY